MKNFGFENTFYSTNARKRISCFNAFYASYAHKQEHVEIFLETVDDTFKFISKSIAEGNRKDT